MRNACFSRAVTRATRQAFSRSRQVITLVILASWLPASTGQCVPASTSLVDHNRVVRPYPEIYQRQKLDQLAARSAPPAKKTSVLVAAGKPVVANPSSSQKRTVVELITSSTTRSKPSVPIEKTPAQPELPPLVNAILGSGDSPKPGKSFRIGYGKMLADNSRTVGARNGTLLEEPSCLYVKTTVKF